MPACPAAFFVATPAVDPAAPLWQRGWGAASGRGLDETAALAATLAEAIERMSVWTRGPGDPLLVERGPEAGEVAARSRRFLNLSEKQVRREYDSWQSSFGAEPWKPIDDPQRGAVVFRDLLTGAPRAVDPLVGLFGEEFLRGGRVQLSSSSGTAVHDTFERALEGALAERVERDAVALWWYNRLVPPRIPFAAVRERLPPALGDFLAERGRRTRFLDLPTDLPATVALALSVDPDGRWPSLGVSADLDPDAALASAALEMLQGEVSLRLMENAQGLEDPPPVPPFLAWSRATRPEAVPYLSGAEPGEAVLPRGRAPFRARGPASHGDLLAAFEAGGIEVLVADITRAEFGVPCARAISADLRDWAPRFAPGRLYDVPVRLGLVPSAPREADLNPVPFVL